VTISWQADAGFDYQIEVSNDLLQWFDTLPGASLSGVTATAPMSYTDTTAPQGTAAYYRVTRTESP
jgi:hypothetical protein